MEVRYDCMKVRLGCPTKAGLQESEVKLHESKVRLQESKVRWPN